jgi:GDPmannose 4,6-dehydratase
MRTALITGITGQDGSYLAELLLREGYRVVGLVRDLSHVREDNLRAIRRDIEVAQVDLQVQASVESVIAAHRPDEIYNLAARASSRTLVADPALTGELNGMAVVRFLEAIRSIDPKIRFYQASSSEMYGRSRESPQSEETAFRPRNPYGVAKLFAHGMVGAYREHYGIFACSGILFNHESPRRGEDFVTRKITRTAARIKAGLSSVLELGDLEATRDWGYAADYVRAMHLMLQADRPDDYVLATGEAHSVREFCEIAFRCLHLDYRQYVKVDPAALRAPDHVQLVGNSSKARKALGWRPSVSFEDLVTMMVDADARAVSAHQCST